MVKLTLVQTGTKANTNLAHRASANEGEAIRRLLEGQGYICKRTANGQMEFRCFAGETRYLTREGMRSLAETVGSTQYVLDSSAQWVPAEIREFGTQRLHALTVRRNKVEKVIYATADHRWFKMTAGEGKRRRRSKELATVDLRPGDRLAEMFPVSQEGRVRSAPTGWSVVSVQETDRVETVYCAVVPGSASFTLEDNILTGNCPFHEGPGQIENRKSASFYVNAENSKYYCQNASCGERGNLQTMERFFGFESDQDDAWIDTFKSRESKLREYEKNLVSPQLRKPFYEHGLTDATIERFRLGFEPAHTEEIDGRQISIPDRYVIPYLDGRRPVAFRYYQPYGEPKYKYMWEPGSEARLYNAQDAIGDKDGVAFICEGEMKAMLLVQMGYAAVAVPGAGQWRDEFQAAFTHARKVVVCFDNDNPIHHIYDKPERKCMKCSGKGLDRCAGHNPGQEAAMVRVEQIGWRASNVLLPLPDDNARKTDINDYFVRDGATGSDFAHLALGKSATPFKVQTLAEIMLKPPEEATFLVANGILPKGGRLLIAGKPKVGKAQAKSTPVLSIRGWTDMGSLAVGDVLVGADGKGVTVRAIHPQGVMPIYRVTMSDGSSTNCTAQHLWTIQTHNDREYAKKDGRPRWRVLEAADIKRLLDQGRVRDTYLPMVQPVQYAPSGPLLLDPYGLGLMLGDGSMHSGSPSFVKPDRQLHEALAKSFPEVDQVPIDAARGVVRLSSRGRENTLIQGLRELGLWGTRSWDKFVPEAYLRASVEDRLALLQGLLDTDGWVQWNASKKNSSAYFGTSSERLKDGVVELVESLGGQVRVQHKPEPKFQDGIGRPAWVVRVRLPQQFEPFRLTRKLDEWRSGRSSKETDPVRRIVSIEYSHDEEAQCITVDREDGLYVTEHFIVTHNSICVDNLALSLASGIPFLGRFAIDSGDPLHPGIRTMLLDRELSKRSLFNRMGALMDGRPGYRAAVENLLIDHDHLIRLDQDGAYDTLANLVETNGAEVLVMDTAYKFLSDVENAKNLMKAFEVLDRLIHSTGVAIVMTHHLKKGQGGKGKENTDVADPDGVAGSFLWTGWPNATILLNYAQRSVENPFNAVATFTAFRDAAAPEPLILYRDRDSISYTAIQDYSHEDAPLQRGEYNKPSTEAVQALLLELAPITEEEFLHLASVHFGSSAGTIRPYFLDAMTSGYFERTSGRPPVIRYKGDQSQEPETWEAEHGLPERSIPESTLDEDMFEAASFVG